MERLSALYTELADYRGMVQLYEDQILRGRDQRIAPSSRARSHACGKRRSTTHAKRPMPGGVCCA